MWPNPWSDRHVAGPVVALLFVISGVTGAWAAWTRWDVCLDETAACAMVQDHRYDYLLPSEPWVQITGAAELQGISLLALGLALVLIAQEMRGLLPFRALVLLPAAAAVVTGLPTLLSGLSGVAGVLPDAAEPLLDGWYYAGPVVLLFLAAYSATRDPLSTGLTPSVLTFVWVALAVATPLVESHVLNLLAPSLATPQGTGLLSSGLALGCGAVLLVRAMVLPPSRPAPRPIRPAVRA